MNLETLLAAAVRERAETRRRADLQRDLDEQARSLAVNEARARAYAPANAQQIWGWLSGTEADRLRDMMRDRKVDRVRLGTWSLTTGAPCVFGFGTVGVAVPRGEIALHVRILRPGLIGHVSRLVRSPDDAKQVLPPLALASLAAMLRDGRPLA